MGTGGYASVDGWNAVDQGKGLQGCMGEVRVENGFKT